MILKDFFTMVHTYQGNPAAQIEEAWNIICSPNGPGTGDWQYYHDCWVVDGEHPWDGVVQQRVNARYTKGCHTKDPFAYDHQEIAKPKQRPARRILNA